MNYVLWIVNYKQTLLFIVFTYSIYEIRFFNVIPLIFIASFILLLGVLISVCRLQPWLYFGRQWRSSDVSISSKSFGEIHKNMPYRFFVCWVFSSFCWLICGLRVQERSITLSKNKRFKRSDLLALITCFVPSEQVDLYPANGSRRTQRTSPLVPSCWVGCYLFAGYDATHSLGIKVLLC